MIETNVTNNYLKTQLNELEKHYILHEDDLDFEVLSDENEEVKIIPLFTDADEFYKYYPSDSKYAPLPNEISVYTSIVNEYDLDGCAFNPASSEFILEKELFDAIILDDEFEIDEDAEDYSAEEMYDISQKTTNDSLVEFIRSDNDSFEELMLLLAESLLFNLAVSGSDLSQYAVDNIISKEDAGDFSICFTGDEDNHFGMLFTSVDAMRQTMDDEDENYYYYQINLFDDFLEFILLNDMDGIIINPGLDDYFITREYLLEAYHGLTYNNPGFNRAADYAFIL